MFSRTSIKVVIISEKNFNLELDDYLSSRRSTEKEEEPNRFFLGFKNFIASLNRDSIIKKEEIMEEIYEEKEPIKEEYVEEDFEEDSKEIMVKEPFFLKLKRLFSLKKDINFEVEEHLEDEVVEMDTKNLPEDIKDVLRIQNEWLKYLSSYDIKRFKESEDFKTYKEVLSKYNLIK